MYARPDVEEFKLSQQDLLQFGALFAGRIALTCVDGGCSILSMVEDIQNGPFDVCDDQEAERYGF